MSSKRSLVRRRANLWFRAIVKIIFLESALVLNFHSLTLNEISLRSFSDRVVHVDDVAHHVEEDRGRRGQHSRHERRLDQLEVDLSRRFVAKDRVRVCQVHFQVVGHTEGLRVDTFRSQGIHVVIVCGVLAKEPRAWRALAFACDLEL